MALAVAQTAARQQDVDRALADVREKASAGDAIAQFTLGSILYYGTPQTAQAIEWFRKAAAQSFAPAELQLGQLYEGGFGVPSNETDAMLWYRRAADHESPAGQRSVGDFYLKGRAVAADPLEAVRWYRRAADGDDLRAQYLLADMHFSGERIPRDYISAYVWFTIAAGQTPLLDNRKQLLELANVAAARMTPEQIAEAKRRVDAWRPATPRK
jgi:TPR repeat protein